jgi:Fe2+ or Zn2+ uptake regulation protein
VDVPADFPDLSVPPGTGHGFTVSRTEIVFRGTCADCSNQPTNQPTPRKS